MFDAYAAAREAAASLLCTAGFAADAGDIRPCAAGAPLSTALPLAQGLDAGQCAAALQTLEAKAPQTLLGAPAFCAITARGGHLCFSLTDAAYGALMQAVIACCEMPPMPAELWSGVNYAICRMRMLARQESMGCPDNGDVRHALWLAFGIGENGIKEKERQARAEQAAKALVTMGHGLPPAQRGPLLASCGDIGKCAARLLWHAAQDI